MSWQDELEVLATMRTLADRMGGESGVERQHGQHKLTVRERIDRLVDPGTFAEIKSALGDAT